MGFGIQQTLVQVLALLFNASVTLSLSVVQFLEGDVTPSQGCCKE